MPTPLFEKLNLGAHRRIHVLNAPGSFEPALAALDGVAVHRAIAAEVAFAIGFAVTCAERDALSAQLVSAAVDDAVLWIAYPKGSSKRHRAEFNRDGDWSVLRGAGFEPVRMVAIDADWSALRFRRRIHIRSSTRSVKAQ